MPSVTLMTHNELLILTNGELELRDYDMIFLATWEAIGFEQEDGMVGSL
jgi:hypothetical protein